MTPQRRSLIEWHAEHGGYCTPPGRMVCARQAADAEEMAQGMGITFLWEYDDMPWDGDIPGYCPENLYGCTMLGPDGEHLPYSLWSIDSEPGSAYARVVEAELAAEYLSDRLDYRDQLAAFMVRIGI